ncbi:MAG: DsbA family protein [Proteobacteria bacterium]|jgi:protein-disulfide isomerase|nr:DsbA family protein [Pseudomonadota bacterium]
MHRGLRRLTKVALAALAICACDDFPVEHCVAGQGIALDDDDAPRLGPGDAPVELAIFGDFQCPGTAQLWFGLGPFLDRLAADGRSDSLAVRFHHFPLTSIHERAYAAAVGAAAAHRQGDEAFWRLFPLLLKPAAELTDGHIASYAAAAGLDTEAFAADLGSDEVAAEVERDAALAGALELAGTPSVLLCGVPVSPYPDDVVDNLSYLIY